MTRLQRIVQFSGGVMSWAAARRVVDRFGPEDVTLLFADTCMEDEDLYRFLGEATANLGARLVRVADGRTPWEVFRDERFLGNSRIDPCSKILKRQLLDRWMRENTSPETSIRYVGLDWTEEERFARLATRMLPWRVEAPMCEPPRLGKYEVLAWCREQGMEPPRLYGMGFSHNNCGGFCVKGGKRHFRLLLRALPERYAYHEEQERLLRAELGDVSILRDRVGGETRPLTLAAFRRALQSNDGQGVLDLEEEDECRLACGCGLPSDEISFEVPPVGGEE